MDKGMMKALEADGEKLRQLTGEDHGPVFLCSCQHPSFCEEYGACWEKWAKNRHFEYGPPPLEQPLCHPDDLSCRFPDCSCRP